MAGGSSSFPHQVCCNLSSRSGGLLAREGGASRTGEGSSNLPDRVNKGRTTTPGMLRPTGDDGRRWLRCTLLVGAGRGSAPKPVIQEGPAGVRVGDAPLYPTHGQRRARISCPAAPPLAPPQPGGLARAAARLQHHSRRRCSAPSPSVFLSFSRGGGGEGRAKAAAAALAAMNDPPARGEDSR